MKRHIHHNIRHTNTCSRDLRVFGFSKTDIPKLSEGDRRGVRELARESKVMDGTKMVEIDQYVHFQGGAPKVATGKTV